MIRGAFSIDPPLHEEAPDDRLPSFLSACEFHDEDGEFRDVGDVSLGDADGVSYWLDGRHHEAPTNQQQQLHCSQLPWVFVFHGDAGDEFHGDVDSFLHGPRLPVKQ